MSSTLNTLLQYFLIAMLAYLYTQAPWNKKNSGSSGSSSPIGGALGKLHASGLTGYYSDRKKQRAQLAKKKNTEIEQEKVAVAVAVGEDSDTNSIHSKDSPLRESPQLNQRQRGQKQASADSTRTSSPSPSSSPSRPSPTTTTATTVIEKKRSKRSHSGSPPPSTKPKTASNQQQSGTAALKKSHTAPNVFAVATTAETSSVSAEEALKHRRFLSEMFKDIPSSEIERVMRSVHFDMDEAATLLAQEDYTWQSVRRRRIMPSLEVA